MSAAPLSDQGLAVLRALAAVEAYTFDSSVDDRPCLETFPAGALNMPALTRAVREPGRSLSVTRASLSRTLRRLWRAGLVELVNGHETMTGKREAARQRLTTFEADPAGAYRGYCAWSGSCGWAVRYLSVEAFLEAKRDQARRCPAVRVRKVQITEAGRARLTANARAVNRQDDSERLSVAAARELTEGAR